MESTWNMSSLELYRLVCEKLLSKRNGTSGDEDVSCAKLLEKHTPMPPKLDIFFSTDYNTKIVLTLLYTVTFLFAVFGNIVVFLTFAFNPRMRSTTNSFIVSLAVSDFFMAVTCMPINLGTVHTTYWIFGGFGCKLVPYGMTVAVACSSLTLCCIALDRYKAIVHPLKLRFYVTSGHVTALILIVWILAAVSSIPNAIFYEIQSVSVNYSDNIFEHTRKEQPESFELCAWTGSIVQEGRFLWFQLVFLFIVPFLVMVVFYGIIGYRLWIRKPIGNRLIYLDNKNTRMKKKVIKLLVVVLTLFTACWSPLLVFDVIVWQSKQTQNLLKTRHYLQLLAMSSTCYNPVIYTIMNENFKDKFANAICCRRNRVAIARREHNVQVVTRIKVRSLNSTMTYGL